jgi:hypothetical protein
VAQTSAQHGLFAHICGRMTEADLLDVAGQSSSERTLLARLREHIAARRLPDEDFDEVDLAYVMMLGRPRPPETPDAFVASLNLNQPVGGSGADEAAAQAVDVLDQWCAGDPHPESLLSAFLGWRLADLDAELAITASRIRAILTRFGERAE